MWFSSWLANRNSSQADTRGHTSGSVPRKRSTFRPRLEALEDRWLPSFGAPVAYQVPGGQFAVVTADVNGDGKPDLITANRFGFTVLLGKGGGKFAASSYQYPGQAGTNTPTAFTVADINGDGKPDIVVANSPGDGGMSGVQPSISVFLNNGKGTFQNARTSYVLPSDAFSLAVADFNGDGKPDIVAKSRDNNVTVVLNNGGGTFNNGQTYPLTTLSFLLSPPPPPRWPWATSTATASPTWSRPRQTAR
jgi:hypothetical protein